MKKISIFLLFTIAFCTQIKAQSGYNYFDLSGGYSWIGRNAITAEISYEKTNKYHNSFSYFAENYIQNKATYKIKDYVLGANYKFLLFRAKNTSLRLQTGAQLGSNTLNFIFGFKSGFELSQSLSNGLDVFLKQDDDYIFRDAQAWRSGIKLGIKIPLN